jgi:hypothetical protein
MDPFVQTLGELNGYAPVVNMRTVNGCARVLMRIDTCICLVMMSWTGHEDHFRNIGFLSKSTCIVQEICFDSSLVMQ